MCKGPNNPKQSHLNVMKRIFKYLLGTKDMGLWYPRGDDFELVGTLKLVT